MKKRDLYYEKVLSNKPQRKDIRLLRKFIGLVNKGAEEQIHNLA